MYYSYIYIVLFLVLLMITIWFFKAPQVRYGLSFLIIFSSYPIILFSNYFYGNYYQRYPSLVIEKFINYLLTFLLIFFISKNILRIFEFYPKNEFYNDNLVPLKNTYFNSKTLNNFKFQFPNNNLCGNSELICTNFYTKFIESEPDISKKNGYLFITNK